MKPEALRMRPMQPASGVAASGSLAACLQHLARDPTAESKDVVGAVVYEPGLTARGLRQLLSRPARRGDLGRSEYDLEKSA